MDVVQPGEDGLPVSADGRRIRSLVRIVPREDPHRPPGLGSFDAHGSGDAALPEDLLPAARPAHPAAKPLDADPDLSDGDSVPYGREVRLRRFRQERERRPVFAGDREAVAPGPLDLLEREGRRVEEPVRIHVPERPHLALGGRPSRTQRLEIFFSRLLAQRLLPLSVRLRR